MYITSKEKSEKVLELYNQGIILTKICEETKTSQPTVKKILAENGIDYNAREKEKYHEKLDLVLKLYEEGKSQTYIEKELNLTRKTIRELLKNKEIHYKSKSEQWRLRYGNTLKEDVFETITPESAYWIGMLYTDGHIGGEDARGYNVELGLQISDFHHIEKYQNFLECSNEIDYIPERESPSVRLRVGSERLHQSLRNLGFTNQKSYDAIPHETLKNNRDFWRGCIDGDGGIYNRTKKQASRQLFLCGTLDTIVCFICFCEDNLQLYNKKLPTRCSGINHYQISYYGKEVEQIADLLYKNATVYLDRKYKIYQEWQTDLVDSE